MNTIFDNNCTDCKYKLYGMVISGHNTEKYVSPLEFQELVLKYGYENCIFTGNIICNNKNSISYKKQIMENYVLSDDFVFNCTEFEDDGGET